EEAWSKLHWHLIDSGKRAVPAHPVRLTRPFYLAEREVSFGEFLNLMKREPGEPPKRSRNTDLQGPLIADCTWFDCIAFCNRLSGQKGLPPASQVKGREVTMLAGATGYRLPTEAEWEFACRAGTTSLWYFGLTAQEALAMRERNLQQAQGYLRDRTLSPN